MYGKQEEEEENVIMLRMLNKHWQNKKK